MSKPGRNDPCTCGSGKKYKRCCGAHRGASVKGRRTEDLLEAQRLCQRGDASRSQGRTAEAIAFYERALPLNPDLADVHNGLGLALAAQGRTERAIAHYERALSLKPDDALIHNNLGSALAMTGGMERAVIHFRRALALAPNDAQIHNNLGNALRLQGEVDAAVAHHERALSLMPGYALAHHNLGSALMLQGRVEEAVAHHERALSLSPGLVTAHYSRLLTLNYSSEQEPAAVYAAHLDFARRWEAPLAGRIQPHANVFLPAKRLRVGYVSPDFRQHSVSYFIEPVLAHHDHDRFEIFCYSNHPQQDEVTQRLKSRADHWLDIAGLSDEQAADRIRTDQIDILVDLAGHMGGNRLLVFARKPAPVQVTWLGYPNTTGLAAMDYRLTDGFADPPGASEHLYTERLIRLPECFSCYKPPDDAPDVSTLPAGAAGYITFGSFNNMAKITPPVLAVWGRILQSLPGSRLVLKNFSLNGDVPRQSLRKAFLEFGIGPERLDFFGHDRSSRAHLERYQGIDIGLDTFPYNGTTTTCEALWMGVPVVTLAGRAHAGRVGVSLLSNLGLATLIGSTAEEYIAAALRLAADLDSLSALRAGLRSRLASSPLTQARRFTENLEQIYRDIWKARCLENLPGNASS